MLPHTGPAGWSPVAPDVHASHATILFFIVASVQPAQLPHRAGNDPRGGGITEDRRFGKPRDVQIGLSASSQRTKVA